MINPVTKLTIAHDDNSVYVDHSDKAADYIRDDFSVELIAAEDYLYIGYTKNFGAAYIELATPNINANTLAADYWNGTIWTSMPITDETQGLTRSGFMFWDKSLLQSAAINSINAFYIRLRPSVDQSATSIRGINLVFADDNMLKGEFFEIDNASILPSGENSHIAHHVAARNTIVQHIRNEGNLKKDVDGVTSIIDQWDLIDIFEIREAAVNLTLSRIFFNLSDDVEDHWWTKYKEYKNRYQRGMQGISNLSLDSNDDGIDDTDEKNASVQVQRWRR